MKASKCLIPVFAAALATGVAANEGGPSPEDTHGTPLRLAPVPIPGFGPALVCRNVPYGPRQPGAGAANRDVAQIYDLYLPQAIGEIDRAAPFFLYVHGGAWQGGNKEWPVELFVEMAKKGFIVASMNYAVFHYGGGEHSFADMLADIDAMVSQIPDIAKAIGMDIPRFAIGGSSAGGHLALLYAYDGADPSALGLSLAHSVPVACVFSDCGPSDLACPEFAVAGMEQMKGGLSEWCNFFRALAGGRFREKEPLLETVARVAKYSPVNLVGAKCPPTICLYGWADKIRTDKTFEISQNGATRPYTALWKAFGSDKKPPTYVGTDGIVTTQNYVTLTNRLSESGVPFAARIEPYPHCQILFKRPDTRPWLYENLRKFSAKP